MDYAGFLECQRGLSRAFLCEGIVPVERDFDLGKTKFEQFQLAEILV